MKRICCFILTITSAVSFCAAQSDSVQYQLQPVTVTATRIAEPWLQVPLALDVIRLNGVFTGKGYGLDEALAAVPGVLAQSRYGNQDVRLSIRGFGARGAGAKSNAGTSRGIRVLLDGFPETEPDGRTSMDLIDLSSAGSIEVVRSNASSIWGNASGGVINISSNTEFAAPFSILQSSLGSYGFHKEMIQAGTMLDAGRFFLSLTNTNTNGWRYHSGSTQTLLNTGLISPLGGKTSIGVYLTGTSNLFRIPGPLSQAQFDSLPQQADSSFIKRDERRFNRLGRLGVSLSHDLNASNNLSTAVFIGTKILQRSERGTFRDFNRYHVGGNMLYRNTISFTETMKNTLLAGLDEAYQDGAIHFYGLTPSGDRATTVKDNKREGANSFGAFLQNEISWSENFSTVVGARYDNVTYYYDDYITPSLNDQKSFQHVTPKFGLTYRFSSTQSAYMNIGGGVEVPAGNEVDPSPSIADGQLDTVRALNPLLEPISSTTVEIGTKQIVALGERGERAATLMYDIALYRLEVRNDIVPYDDGGFYFTAGKTRRMGLEAGAHLQFNNGLSLEPSLTLSRNTYVEYVIDSIHYDHPGKFANLKDNTMSGVPEFFYSLGIRYAPTILGGLYVRATLQGIGEYYADDRNLYKVPAYSIMNVGAGIDRYQIPRSTFFIRGFVGVNNIADKKYAAAAWINPQMNASGLPVYLEPGLPRNIVGSVSLGIDL